MHAARYSTVAGFVCGAAKIPERSATVVSAITRVVAGKPLSWSIGQIFEQG